MLLMLGGSLAFRWRCVDTLYICDRRESNGGGTLLCWGPINQNGGDTPAKSSHALRNQSNNLQTQGIFLSLPRAHASAAETVGWPKLIILYSQQERYLPVPLSLKCYSHWPRERKKRETLMQNFCASCAKMTNDFSLRHAASKSSMMYIGLVHGAWSERVKGVQIFCMYHV